VCHLIKWVKKFYKWASLFVGIQFLLWLLSGFYLNLMGATKAAGRTYQAKINYENLLESDRMI
jgi:Na+-transporting NADH:ubiquinone oxidoreductase subunit F